MNRYLRIIVMASGLGRRFGENKLLQSVGGVPMYQHVLRLVLSFIRKYPDRGEIVVVSAYEEILHEAERWGCRGVKNPHAERGISESIKLGIRTRRDHGEKPETAVFLTADQPWMEYETLERFLLLAGEMEEGFLCARSGDILGNPVSFHEKYYDELMLLQGDQGGKAVMKRHLEEVRYFEVPLRELKDVDFREDLAGEEEDA